MARHVSFEPNRVSIDQGRGRVDTRVLTTLIRRLAVNLAPSGVVHQASTLIMRKRRRIQPARNRKRQRGQLTNNQSLVVECTPPVESREVETILRCSLKALYGDFERYSCCVKVLPQDNSDRPLLSRQEVSCPKTDVPFVRAALTLATAPLYDDRLHRIDVIDVLGYSM